MAQKSQGTGTSSRGFASMDASKQREIASKGGQSVPAAKRSFSQDRRLAAEAGRKGGQSSHGGGRSKQMQQQQQQQQEGGQAPAGTRPAASPNVGAQPEEREHTSEAEKVDSQ